LKVEIKPHQASDFIL